MKTIAYAIAYSIACFIGLFIMSFVFFGASELLIPKHKINLETLSTDTLTWTFKLWCTVMIVSVIKFFINKRQKSK